MGNRTGAAVRRSAMLLLMVVGLGFGGGASGVLLDRGPDMVYDTVSGLTWTRRAGDGVLRNWADANAWAADLVFAGYDDWRLPYANIFWGAGPVFGLPIGQPCTGGTGFGAVTACLANEMAYMFYYNLGGTHGFGETGTQTDVGGWDQVLTGIKSVYWSGTEIGPTEIGPGGAYVFQFSTGDQGDIDEGLPLAASWAVRFGDSQPPISGAPGNPIALPGEPAPEPAPEPASLPLIGLGALGLAWSRRQVQRR